MGIFDKLAFWKKKDDFGDLGGDFGSDMGGDFASDMGNDIGNGMPNDLQQDLPPGLEMTNPMNPQKDEVNEIMSQGNQGFANQQKTYNPTEISGNDQYNAASPYPGNSPMMNQQTPMQSNHQEIMSKDIEVVSSKIDALRASIDSVNQRLINVEHLIREEREAKYKW